MSDLSWLNPTPHAIAVYASQPLSPAATQHSLPSGRYSLLGPDFHRLDRASFAWRTHSITSSAAISSLSGIVMPRRSLACQATERRNGTRGVALLGGEAIEQPVAAGAAQVGLATAAIGPARGMR